MQQQAAHLASAHIHLGYTLRMLGEEAAAAAAAEEGLRMIENAMVDDFATTAADAILAAADQDYGDMRREDGVEEAAIRTCLGARKRLFSICCEG